jgi:starvation-inducible outer membrane lipoprotein
MKLADLMLCLYLLASLAMGLSGCVTTGTTVEHESPAEDHMID